MLEKDNGVFDQCILAMEILYLFSSCVFSVTCSCVLWDGGLVLHYNKTVFTFI